MVSSSESTILGSDGSYFETEWYDLQCKLQKVATFVGDYETQEEARVAHNEAVAKQAKEHGVKDPQPI